MVLTTLVCIAAMAEAKWNLPGSAPHLVFHYLPWYTAEKPVGKFGPWNHWEWRGPGPHDPRNRVADGKRDIASLHYPLIGPYSSDDRLVVRYHMQTMKAAGGEAVAVDWATCDDETDARMPLILDEAQKAGLKVAICYEEKANFVWPELRNPKDRKEAVQFAVKDFKYILAKYAAHSAFMRRNGKPFFFQFNGWGDGKIGKLFFSPEEYRQILAQLPQSIEFGRQGLESDYDSSSKFRYLWYTPRGADAKWFSEEGRRRISAGEIAGLMTFICPGFDDSGVSGWSGTPRVQPREGLSYLFGTFNNSFLGNPELIQVVTWNDFNEGTDVEPSREVGFQYLDALATWWAKKKGVPANLDAIRKPFLEYMRTATNRADLPSKPAQYLEKKKLDVSRPKFVDEL